MRRALSELLRIEDSNEIVTFRSGDGRFLLWPLIRNQFLRLAISRETGSSWIRLDVHRPPWRHVLTTIARSVARNVMAGIPDSRYVIMASGAGNVVINGRFFNGLSDHFAAVAPEETLCVEGLSAWEWPFPRVNERTISYEPFRLRAALPARVLLNETHRRTASDLLEFVSARAQDTIGWRPTAADLGKLRRALALQIAGLPQLANVSEGLLRKTGARLVLKEEGCYGHSSVFNTVAREMGVLVAEYQHGAIHAGHDAYHFAPALSASPAYQRALPQYLLTYGEWWSQEVSAPVQTVAIGNPHRSERLLQRTAVRRRGIHTMLVLGDGVNTERFIAFAESVSQRLGERWEVWFRPHPLERSAALDLCSRGKSGTRLDVERDLYRTFFAVDMVVSEASSALFEAIGVVERIAIWSGDQASFCYPTHPFDSFVDAEDLVNQMEDEGFGSVDVSDVGRMWAPDWRLRYSTFLNSVEK